MYSAAASSEWTLNSCLLQSLLRVNDLPQNVQTFDDIFEVTFVVTGEEVVTSCLSTKVLGLLSVLYSGEKAIKRSSKC